MCTRRVVPHIYAAQSKGMVKSPCLRVKSEAVQEEMRPMSTTKITTATVALAVVAAFALTGCTGPTTSSATPSSAASSPASVTVIPSATPTPTATQITSGAVLTADKVKALPNGVRAYTLADGSRVATVQGVALPAPVAADITAKAQAALGGELNGTRPRSEETAKSDALKAAVKDAGVTTGRLVVAVFPVYGYASDHSTLVHFWNTSRFDGHFFDTAEQAKADVEQQFAQNPAGVEIVVLTK